MQDGGGKNLFIDILLVCHQSLEKSSQLFDHSHPWRLLYDSLMRVLWPSRGLMNLQPSIGQAYITTSGEWQIDSVVAILMVPSSTLALYIWHLFQSHLTSELTLTAAPLEVRQWYVSEMEISVGYQSIINIWHFRERRHQVPYSSDRFRHLKYLNLFKGNLRGIP